MIVSSLLNRLSRSLILSLFLAIPLLSSAQYDLKINELMPKNVSFLMDKSYITQTYKKFENGVVVSSTTASSMWVTSNVWTNTKNFSMWVEVYNNASTTKTLSDYYFTDDLSKPKKWRPLSVNGSVTGKGFSVLFFEREDEEAYTSYVRPEKTNDLYILNRQGHANFKLNPDGGKLYLLNASLAVLDSVVYPAQYRNISYGRSTDGTGDWVFFDQPSPGGKNKGSASGTQRCLNPTFALKNGFYTTAQTLRFVMPAAGDTIYYTTNGSEPTRSSTRYTPNTNISLAAGVRRIRAKTFSWGKLSSDVITNTYFIGDIIVNGRKVINNLPVVSIVTDDAYINSKDYGLYYAADNLGIGLPGRGQNNAKNPNQDWDRPVNFEFFDKNGQPQLNQEVDIKILGGWSRFFSGTQKSLAISPRDKFGVDQLNYDFFAGSKPGHQYKDIQLRNSGNDNGKSMMLDGFILSISANRMDVDYLAYEPAVLFLNGNYIGIQNIRERSNADFLFSNYGYAKDDVEIIEAIGPTLETKNDMKTDPAFNRLVQFLKTNDLSKPEVYRQVCDSIDVDEFINYMIPQVYVANTDWPDNNVKMWRKKNGGKWRWILYDTDFGFDNSRISHNTLTFALGEYGGSASSASLPEWSYIVFRKLCESQEFIGKLVDRFAIHMSTTYMPTRINAIMDSLANRIDEEYPNVKNYLSGWRSFASTRNITVMNHIADRFLKDGRTGVVPTIDTLNIDANINGATYSFNTQPLLEKKAKVFYYRGRTLSLKANHVYGYRFDHWSYGQNATILPMQSEWKYYYSTGMPLKDGVPSADWYKTNFVDTTWTNVNGACGHEALRVDNTIPYTITDSTGKVKKCSTAYFRKSVIISDLANKEDIRLNVNLFGGAVVYVNGVEVGRVNMLSGAVSYSTFAWKVFDEVATLYVPKKFFKEGENLIAVEVHKFWINNMRFDLGVTHQVPVMSNEPELTTTVLGRQSINAYYVPFEEPALEKNIVINEVVSNNIYVMDEYGVKEDYIELYNKGTEAVNIGGWYITDTPGNKLFHQIPANNPSVTTIQPGGHLILWADDEANQGTQHVGFKLGKDGETLVLSKKIDENTVVVMDSVSFPALGSLSYSRITDGADTWAIQALSFNGSNVPTGVPSVEESLIALYPTQVTESFTVRNADGLMVSVIDITGKVLRREVCTSNEMTVPTGDLKRGMYLVMVGEKTFKILRR